MPCHTDGIIFGVVGLGTQIKIQEHNNMLSLLVEMGSYYLLGFYFEVLGFDLRAL
jgi:hypothetical protein